MTNSLEKITALSFFPLPAAEDPNMALDTLPDIRPTFFVPRLADKPQNPIMDTLYLLNHGRKYPILTDRLPIELEVITNDLQLAVENSHIMQGNLWDYVATQKAAESSCLMSWDRLRSSLNARVSPSAFLSQQTDQVFASARYYVRPSLRDPSLQLVYVTPQELFHSLRITLSGISSPFHIWDPRFEMFVLRGIEEGKKGAMVITGKDEVVCSSFVHRFLTIGTLMRRLDTLVVNHRKSHSRTEPVHHAFMHALSSILAFLRQVAVALPSSMTPDPEILPGDTAALAASWLHYAELEEVLQAFAALCHREQHVTPTAYAKIPSSASQLLTNIYQSLNGHLERRSPRIVNALFAYILTMISRDYFRQVCHSVGYTLNGVSPLDAIQSRRTVDGHQESGLLDEEDEEDQNAVLDEDDVTDNSFPCFFEPYVTDAIVRARRSLQLLLSARPDHPLLNSQLSRRQIKWIWTVDEIEAAWNDDNTTSLKSNIGEQMRIPVDAEEIASTRQQRLYRAELKHFGVFDLAPGSKAAQAASSGPLLNHSAISDLQAFVREFPSSLPLLTPTLSHLTSLILSPLVRHIDSLSSALVSLFLSPSTHLNLRAHLTLLRSYLLLTSHSFKWRLKYALFSDSGDFESARAGTRSFAALNSHSSTRNGQRSKSGESSGRWVVGLSPSLTEGGSWPPGGADLAFQLRTAIVDSLKSIRSPERHDEFWTLEGQERILEEAEHRLGFVLRDLPSGTGKEKWLDPLCMFSFVLRWNMIDNIVL
ncbi:hypothetical protein AcV5_007095 [Taiwanofungus camphoratus]|nr:hypothetical protein AcV5_007095 [Antrodia cinnamomea]